MEVNELDLNWLAGLLEGEGSFCIGSPSSPGKPTINLQMTDEEVVAKVASLWHVRYHINALERSKNNNWHTIFSIKISGQRAVEFMTLLRPLMGQRRQGQIDKALANYTGDKRKILQPIQLEELRNRALNGESILKLAKEYGISKSLAYNIRNGYTYKRV